MTPKLAAMPTARASRTIAAPADQLWSILSDPYHLPRWWPRVTRVEDVAEGGFTEVMKTRKGKTVRADFEVVTVDEESGTLVWEQRLEGTPFAAVLASSETELRVVPVSVAGELLESGIPGAPAAASEVTIELRQEMTAQPALAIAGRSLIPSMGRRMVRRAAARMIAEALDGLERIGG